MQHSMEIKNFCIERASLMRSTIRINILAYTTVCCQFNWTPVDLEAILEQNTFHVFSVQLFLLMEMSTENSQFFSIKMTGTWICKWKK